MKRQSRNSNPRHRVFFESVEVSDSGVLRRAFQLVLQVEARVDTEHAGNSLAGSDDLRSEPEGQSGGNVREA